MNMSSSTPESRRSFQHLRSQSADNLKGLCVESGAHSASKAAAQAAAETEWDAVLSTEGPESVPTRPRSEDGVGSSAEGTEGTDPPMPPMPPALPASPPAVLVRVEKDAADKVG